MANKSSEKNRSMNASVNKKVRAIPSAKKAAQRATAKSTTKPANRRAKVPKDDAIDGLEVDQFIKQVSGELLDVIFEITTENMVAKSVLLSIAWHTTNDWYCYADAALIAQYAFCTRRDSDAAIKSLESKGIISVEGPARQRRYSIDIRKAKLISQQSKQARPRQVETFSSDDPNSLPRLPGHYPIMNIMVWSAKLQTAQKLVIRYLMDSARDGWSNVLFSELCYVTGLETENAATTLRELVDLNIIAPPAKKTAVAQYPSDYDWARKAVTRCLIKPSGLIRHIPVDR